MTDLALKQCVPCRGGVPPIKGPELQAFLRDVDNGWQVIDEHHLSRDVIPPGEKTA
jgi:4a-hydroxytetrahydrobiopterin dehydratase